MLVLSSDQLMEIIRSGPQFKRPPAIRQLCNIDGSNHVDLLRSLLSDKDWHVRLAAAKGLATLLKKESIPDLIPLLKDKAFGVREDIGKLLNEIKGD